MLLVASVSIILQSAHISQTALTVLIGLAGMVFIASLIISLTEQSFNTIGSFFNLFNLLLNIGLAVGYFALSSTSDSELVVAIIGLCHSALVPWQLLTYKSYLHHRRESSLAIQEFMTAVVTTAVTTFGILLMTDLAEISWALPVSISTFLWQFITKPIYNLLMKQ